MFYKLSIFLFSLFIFLITVGNSSLRNWDEAWYAEIIKNMASGKRGLLVPFWNGHYFLDKPPLYFWLSSPFFKFFGAGEWQARIISILAGAFATLLIYLIAKKLFHHRVGVIASIIFLSLGQVVFRFSHGNLDALLVCFSLATFYFYLLSLKNLPFSILSGLFLGLGFLIKGTLLGLFPLFFILAYTAFVQKKLSLNLLIIIIIAFISSFWWFLLGAIQFNQSLIRWYFFIPFQSTVDWPPSGLSLNYFQYLFRDIGLWLIPLLLFIGSHKKLDSFEKKVFVWLILTSLVFISSLTFLNVNFDWYILPAYPLVAIIVAYAFNQIINLHPKLTSLIVLILAFQILNVIKIENTYPDRSLVGVNLGKYAQKVVPKDATLILDDRDFTSFLFYSNHQTVYVISKEGGKQNEWWTLKYTDLPNFLKNHTSTWIVTSNPNNLLIKTDNQQLMATYQGYYFLRFP